MGVPRVNLNRELSRRLLGVPEQERPRQLFPILQEMVRTSPGEVVLWDNGELLFAPQLQQDSLRCLLDLARHKTLVAAWSGSCQKGYLTYATLDHPEYRRYPIQGFLWVDVTQ